MSALGQLNATGYAIVFALGIVTVWLIRPLERRIDAAARNSGVPEPGGTTRLGGRTATWARFWHKRRRRFRRAFPLAFLVLALLALLGGALHAPNNYDALAYRTPRVLHWLAEGRWHWIHTEFARLNTRAPGFEWVSAPLIAFTRTDRFLYLINIVSFLLLPGLVFSLFTRLGVRPRVAWHWMWLVPSGYCYLLQAGSVGNDLFGAVFGLAAVDFALRARQSQQARDFRLSILAAALLTGSKASNLPLLLPWLLAIAPCLKLLRRSLLPTVAVSLVAAFASGLPQLALNVQYCGDWSGMAAENPGGGRNPPPPLLLLANNSVMLPLQNLTPPIFPFANVWNRAVLRLMPAAWREKLEHTFEPGAAHWRMEEMESEEGAGLGFGVSSLLLLSAVAGLVVSRNRRRQVQNAPLSERAPQCCPLPSDGRGIKGEGTGESSAARREGKEEGANSLATILPLPFRRGEGRGARSVFAPRFMEKGSFSPPLIIASAILALLVFMAKSNLTAIARVVTPYYALFIPALLISDSQTRIVGAVWWRRLALAFFALAGLLLILTPSRPLWPANLVLARVDAASHSLLARARTVYLIYSRRADAFAPARELLPANVRVLGLISFDDPETSLWRPFGHRRIEHVTHTDTLGELRAKGIGYILLNPRTFDPYFHVPFEQWLAEMDAEIVARPRLQLKAGREPADWFLVRLRSVSGK